MIYFLLLLILFLRHFFTWSLLITALLLSAVGMQGFLHASHTKHLFLPLYSSSVPILEHSLISSPTYPAQSSFFQKPFLVFFNPQFSYLIFFCTVCIVLNIIFLLYHTGSPQHVSQCSSFHESFIFINHLSTSRCIYKYRDCGKLCFPNMVVISPLKPFQNLATPLLRVGV